MNLFKTALLVLTLNTGGLMGADFFPLHDGDSWTYREAGTGQTLTVGVGAPVTISGKVYYKLTGYAASDLLVRVEELYGALVYWNETRNEENLLTSFEPFEGGYWVAPFRSCPDQVGQTAVRLGNHDGPAGPIPNVLEINYHAFGCADTGSLQEQYAEHIGMLRRTQQTFAGPRTFDLIAARVGSLSIDAAPTGRFSVSIGPIVAGRPASATFRLRVSSPLTLAFTSGQEYDFALQDADGKTLWTWSADKTFLQSLHKRTVSGEWSQTVEIPWPTDRGGDPQPGDYTLQATVTAAGPTPFAATVPVNVPPNGKTRPAARLR